MALSEDAQYDLEVSAATGRSDIISQFMKLRYDFIKTTGKNPTVAYLPAEYAVALKHEVRHMAFMAVPEKKAKMTLANMEVCLTFSDHLEVS